MTGPNEAPAGTFWDHLDALRSCLLKALAATAVCTLAAFLFRDELFGIVLAPKGAHFVTYQVISSVGRAVSGASFELPDFEVRLINTALAGQFAAHLRTSLFAGFCLASPYIIWLAFRFISPALYESERRAALQTLVPACIMFFLGAAVDYFLIFPLAFRFPGTYQVSPDVANAITLQSYLDTFFLTALVMGIVFEIPALCHVLARMGLLNAGIMRHYRRHAMVGILILSAVITPTSDAVTLMLAACPMYLLYEAGIITTAVTRKRSSSDAQRKS